MSLEDEIIQYVSGKLIIDKDKLSRNSKFTEDHYRTSGATRGY